MFYDRVYAEKAVQQAFAERFPKATVTEASDLTKNIYRFVVEGNIDPVEFYQFAAEQGVLTSCEAFSLFTEGCANPPWAVKLAAKLKESGDKHLRTIGLLVHQYITRNAMAFAEVGTQG